MRRAVRPRWLPPVLCAGALLAWAGTAPAGESESQRFGAETGNDHAVNRYLAVPGQATVPRPNAALKVMLENYWREFLALNPMLALANGETRNEAQFDDSLQDGWRARMVSLSEKYLQSCSEFKSEALSPNDRTSLAMLRERLADAREYYSGALFETARRLPIDQFQGPHLTFASDASAAGNYPFKTLDDYANGLRRADHYAGWTDEAIARLREGLAAEDVLPRVVVERILPQLQAHFGRQPERTEFWQPVAHLPESFSPADRARLARAYRTKIATVIEPAYRRMYDFLSNEYLPHARDSVGLGQIPGGRALYDYDVRYHTTTRLTAAEIHALGLAEVTRIEQELAKVQSELKVDGSLQAFFARVRTDPGQRFTSRDQVVPAFEAARQRIVGRLPLLFDVMPQAEFQIRAMPESAQYSQGNGNYAPAGADGTRPGILWINTYAPGVRDRFNVMTIALHEGLPGHHFQTSLAEERTDLPSFRRFDSTTAYGEGWALYAESLGKEMGLYQEPWDYYGHLNYAILRANRLVVDTGLHAMRWDVARGVDFMMQHSSMNRDQATAEVERYVAYPGQALAYKMGELKIRELRTRAETALGPRFDLRSFHDQILLGGSMPLTVLEERIDRWISAQAPP